MRRWRRERCTRGNLCGTLSSTACTEAWASALSTRYALEACLYLPFFCIALLIGVNASRRENTSQIARRGNISSRLRSPGSRPLRTSRGLGQTLDSRCSRLSPPPPPRQPPLARESPLRERAATSVTEGEAQVLSVVQSRQPITPQVLFFFFSFSLSVLISLATHVQMCPCRR